MDKTVSTNEITTMNKTNDVYDVTQLTTRVYKTLEDQGKLKSKNKLIIDPPQVKFENRKTFFTNFTTICRILNRNTLELQRFFDAELCCKSSIEGNGGMKIDKKFRPDNIRKVLESYLIKYVLCRECNSSKTSIVKENRITYLKCNQCYSKKPINS